MSRPQITVACVKWGNTFGPDYVNVLHRAVASHLAEPHRFLCMTDQDDGLDPGIEVRPFPDFGLPRELWNRNGNWGKLGLFAPGQFPDDEVVLYLDLDVFAVGALDAIAALPRRDPGFHHLEDFPPGLWRLAPHALRPDQGGQGSVLCFRAGEQRCVFDHFTADPVGIVTGARGDRSYWNRAVHRPQYIPPQWCVSFKTHCVRPWPFNRIMAPKPPPASARILVFHGRPRPVDLMGLKGQRWGSSRRSGTKPVPWVVDYWTGYGGRLPEGASAPS